MVTQADNSVVISIILGKGGGGKTSLTTNLTGVIMKQEKKTLIVDLDSQGNVSDAFGLNEEHYSSLNMFHRKVTPTRMITKYNSYLDVIQAHEDMGNLELDLLLSMTRHDNPFDFVKPNIEQVRSNYDYIFIDNPPSLGLIVGNAIAASDYVIIPFVPEPFAIKGLKRVVQAVKEFQKVGVHVKILAVVPMFVESRTKLHPQILSQARQYCQANDIFITDAVIPHSIQFANATAYEGVPATIGSGRHNEIVKKYDDVWTEINGQLKLRGH